MAEPPGAASGEAPRRSGGLLLPACVGAGSLALLATAGVLPAVYLAVGGAGGWYLGKRLRGEPPPEEGPEESSGEESSEEDDEAAAVADEAAGAAAVAPYFKSFLRHLQQGGAGAAAPAAGGPAVAKDVAEIEAGLHEAFSKMPPERLEKCMEAFRPREGPHSNEEVGELEAIMAEISQLMPAAAAAAMERQSALFLPPVAKDDPLVPPAGA
mmetsp:Transcript_12016/g.37096  ORF Transcript_12016/g.37096 Transcript_12016/m.37096 type:complete len:212 (-) Transcript_12016:9-644(-)